MIEVNFPEASGVIGYFRILPLIDNTPQDGKNPLFRFQNCTGKDMKSYDDSEKNIINYSFDDLLDFFSNVSNVNIHTHDFFQQKIQEGKVGVLQDTQIPNKAALEGILNSLDNKDFPLEPGVIIELNENGKSENFEIEAIDDANITIKIDNHRFTFSLSDFYESIYKRYSARRFKRINSPLEALSVAQEVLSDSQDSLMTFSKMSFNARTQEFDFDDK